MSIRETNFRSVPQAESNATDAPVAASFVDLPSLSGLDGVLIVIAAGLGLAVLAWVAISARRNAPRPARRSAGMTGTGTQGGGMP